MKTVGGDLTVRQGGGVLGLLLRGGGVLTQVFHMLDKNDRKGWDLLEKLGFTQERARQRVG